MPCRALGEDFFGTFLPTISSETFDMIPLNIKELFFCQYLVPRLSFVCHHFDVVTVWCQTVRVILLVPNCPIYHFGAKLFVCFLGAKLSSYIILVPNCQTTTELRQLS